MVPNVRRFMAIMAPTQAHAVSPQGQGDAFELVFAALDAPGAGLCFPCDAAGHVDLDRLSDSQRNRYLYARAVVGRALDWPTVRGAWH